ncbi:MAG TPA: hypothetical protein VF002_01050 [Gaiellaceae bacterium]
MNGVLSTPRPLPNRLWPALAGAVLILLALPIFLVAGWPTGGWALGAALYAASQGLALFLSRLPLGADSLRSSGLVAVARTVRVIGVMVVLIAVTVAHKSLGVSAALLFVAAYTLELLVSLVSYFSGEPR